METQKLKSLIKELKNAKNQKQIKSIEEAKEDIIWSKVDNITQDLWYETLGDVKRGLYF
ncbi:hypothetical protein ACFS5M_14210 [Lacinutrix iliipiscaria]|uniref:Uncharacterized protein n=1 Tax=Lacinutrix iliipiscaria TaxID=1230532 RepID=A0ABW5WQZ8_9FLAO